MLHSVFNELWRFLFQPGPYYSLFVLTVGITVTISSDILEKRSNSAITLIGRVILLISLVATMVACNDSRDSIYIDDGAMSIPVPENFRRIAAFESNQLEIQVSINGEVARVLRVNGEDDSVSTVVNMPSDQSNEIVVAWFAIVGSEEVLLADFTEVVTVGTTELDVARYNSTGERFDADNDGRNNLSEAIENRNLLSPFDLEVPRLDSFGGTVAPITDDGIDNNLSGEVVENDEDSVFRLRHTGTDLIVYLCGKDQSLSGDNLDSDGEYWHDDTIFLYLDGADSDNGTYDQIDDFQFSFIRSTREMRVPQGANNQFCRNGECVQFSFFENTSACEYELNVVLPLNELNISLDTPVGFDIEIVDDDNGGLREGSSAWIGYDDESHLDPSTFGTIRLN